VCFFGDDLQVEQGALGRKTPAGAPAASPGWEEAAIAEAKIRSSTSRRMAPRGRGLRRARILTVETGQLVSVRSGWAAFDGLCVWLCMI
jgi:hypothetical protein